ncbi:MAG: hypothetical protein AAF500_20975 [Myxococcota bacterium]
MQGCASALGYGLGKSSARLYRLPMAVSARNVLFRLAKETTWSQFVDYASPALSDVMPLRQILAQGREFVGNSRNRKRFAQTRQEIASVVSSPGLVIAQRHEPDFAGTALRELSTEAKRDAGTRILQIYFAQLLRSSSALLDIRAEAFRFTESSQLSWSPSALYVAWDSEFVAGLRDVYAGFYLDDRGRFDRGLAVLGLEDAEDLLLTHLGDGDQSRVRFTTAAFHASLHELFLRCRDRRISLHRNFLALGVYLICLYDALESLDSEFDVRSAFEQSYQSVGTAVRAC